MTNIFAQDPVYITIQELKDSTSKSEIGALNDEEIKELIYKAELIIDDYIVTFWEKFEETQPFIFPIKDLSISKSLQPNNSLNVKLEKNVLGF